MKKLNRNSISTFIRNCRMGDYLRQFSIVAGGVIVTFWGSSLITERARQKEVRETMHLMTEELRYNCNALKDIKVKVGEDVYMSSLLLENELDPARIPADTLYAYSRFFSNLEDFDYRQDALGVLKGSSQMQNIADKRMLQDILQTYHRLEKLRNNIQGYYDLKKKIFYEIVIFSKRKKDEIVKDAMRDNFLEDVAYFMNQPSFLSYVVVVPNFTDWEEIERLEKKLGEQIRFLEEKY